MSVLKAIALALLSFILLASLFAFGTAFTFTQTALNPGFITGEIDKLSLSAVTREALSYTTSATLLPAINTALANTINQQEAPLKQQINTSVNSIYDYLLGKTSGINLTELIKNTILGANLTGSFVDNVDLSAVVTPYIKQQISGQLSLDDQHLTFYINNVLTTLKPWIKQQAVGAAEPVLSYVLGESRTLNLSISLASVKPTIEDSLRDSFFKFPPTQLTGASSAILETAFIQFYSQVDAQLPSILVINESLIGRQLPSEVAGTIADAESALSQARQTVYYFRVGYYSLIAFMVLIVLGIVLISRRLKTAAISLGVTFIVYGVVEYAGVYFFKNYLPTSFTGLQSLDRWLFQVINHAFSPLSLFCLGMAIGGLALLIVSFLYLRSEER